MRGARIYRRSRWWIALCGAVLMAGLVSPVSSASAAPNSQLGAELSSTARGSLLLDEAVGRFSAASRTSVDRAAYRVINGVPGDPDGVWIVPVGGALPKVSRVSSTGVSFSADTAPISLSVGVGL